MATRLLLLTLAGTLIYFVIGWFVFSFVLGSYTDAHTTHLPGFKKEDAEFSFAALLLSCMAYAALLSFVLVYVGHIDSPVQGAIVAAITGMLIAVMTDSYWFASSHFYDSLYPVLADVAGAGISVGMTGGLMLWLWSYMSRW